MVVFTDLRKDCFTWEYGLIAHNVWNPTLENDDMWDWLFTQKNHYMTTKSEYDDVDRFG